jgi:hypothetical protein
MSKGLFQIMLIILTAVWAFVAAWALDNYITSSDIIDLAVAVFAAAGVLRSTLLAVERE